MAHSIHPNNIILCLLILVNVGLIEMSNVTIRCPSQCVCLSHSITLSVNCSSQGLKSVPANLPRNSTLLFLNNNRIETITPEIISSLPLLTKIDVSSNKIRCDCSLSWIFEANVSIKIIGKCDSPLSLQGRDISGVLNHEMCTPEYRCGLPSQTGNDNPSLKKVNGGNEAAKNSRPWLVNFFDNKKLVHVCGGSIIDREWILTAAHCLLNGMGDSTLNYTKYYVGDHSLNMTDAGEYAVKPSNVFFHPKYGLSSFDYDIALLKLKTPLNYSAEVQPVCLPDKAVHFTKDDMCYAVGWGILDASSPRQLSPYLKQEQLAVVSLEKCNSAESYNGRITNRSLCAELTKNRRSTCHGGSEPLQCKRNGTWVQLGISAGSQAVCGEPNKYSVFTDVRKFLLFIKAIQEGPNVQLTTFHQKSLSDLKHDKPGELNLYDLLTKNQQFSGVDLVRTHQFLPKEIASMKTASLLELEFVNEKRFAQNTKLMNIISVVLKQSNKLLVYARVKEIIAKLNITFEKALGITKLSRDALLNTHLQLINEDFSRIFYVNYTMMKLSDYKNNLMSYSGGNVVHLNTSQVRIDLEKMKLHELQHLEEKYIKLFLVRDNNKLFTNTMTVKNISVFFGIGHNKLMDMSVTDILEDILNITASEFISQYMFSQEDLNSLKHQKISTVPNFNDRNVVALTKAMLHDISNPSTASRGETTTTQSSMLKTSIRVSTMTTTTKKLSISTAVPSISTAGPSVSTTGPSVPTAGPLVPRLQDLVNKSSETQQNVESLRSLIGTLEKNVYNWSHGGEEGTKDLLHVASNLLRNENKAVWEKSNKDFSGVERLLGIVNKAVALQTKQMMKDHMNGTSSSSINFDNLNVEILVGTGDAVGKEKLKFPRSRKPEDDYIEFPNSVFQKTGQKKVAIIVITFRQLEKFLPRLSLMENFDSFQVNSRVLSAHVVSLDDSFSSSVLIRFKNKDVKAAAQKSTKCVFWKYDNAVTRGVNTSKAGWSDEGCRVSSKGKNGTICKCDHLTDFAVLTKDVIAPVKPTLIVYIGGFILLIALVIVLCRDIVVWRRTRRERLLVFINQCFAMILALLVFLLGLFLDYQNVMCTAFGALLQWFLLSVFCWLLAEVTQLYFGVRFGSSRNSLRLKYFILLGWVLPMVFVGIVLAITKLEIYGSNNWCWYTNAVVLHLTYIGPIALCILVGLIIVLKVACLKANMTDDADKKDVGIVLWLSGLLFPLVAATFAIGGLAANQPEEEVFQFVFAIFSIVLGVYMFVYHFIFDREITKMSVRTNNRGRPKRDYYSTKETVTYSEGTPEGKKISLIFPSRKSPPHAKKSKGDKRAKRNESVTPFDYDASVPMYPAINDSSLKSFRSEVSTQQHTLENPPNTLSAITISRPNSQCIELTSLSDLDRRPDGAEQTDCGEPGEFYSGSRHSNPMDRVRQRTSGSSDSPHATTFGKDSRRPVSDKPNEEDPKNRTSVTSSAGISRTSRSSVSGASLGAVEESEQHPNDDSLEKQPFIRSGTNSGPEVRSDPPAKIPKRRKKGSRRRLDDDLQDEEVAKSESDQKLSAPGTTELVEQQYTSF